MSDAVVNQTLGGRRIGRSIGALAAGIVVAVALSLATDMGLNKAGLFPLGEAMQDRTLLVATVYRTVYGVLAGYVMARLAPYGPLGHALVGGVVGLVVSSIGAAATWNRGLGPHWYPLALIVLALPQAWAGGKLFVIQQERRGDGGEAGRR